MFCFKDRGAGILRSDVEVQRVITREREARGSIEYLSIEKMFQMSECLAWVIDLLVLEINPRRDAASDLDLDREFSLCVIADLSRIAMQCLHCQPLYGMDRQGTMLQDQAHPPRNPVGNVDNDIRVYAQLSGCRSFASALHASFSASTRSTTFPLTTVAKHVEHINITICIRSEDAHDVVSNLPFHTGGRQSNAQALSRSTGR